MGSFFHRIVRLNRWHQPDRIRPFDCREVGGQKVQGAQPLHRPQHRFFRRIGIVAAEQNLRWWHQTEQRIHRRAVGRQRGFIIKALQSRDHTVRNVTLAVRPAIKAGKPVSQNRDGAAGVRKYELDVGETAERPVEPQ